MEQTEIENKELQEFKLINWKSILIGIIITVIGITIAIVGSLFRLDTDFGLTSLILAILILGPIIGGFATAYTNISKYKIGIINGALAALMGLIIFMLSLLLISAFLGAQINIVYFAAATILYSIPITLLGIFGAFIGTSIKKLKVKN